MGEKETPSGETRKWVRTALVIAVVAALLLLVWKFRQTQSPTASKEADETQRTRYRSSVHPRLKNRSGTERAGDTEEDPVDDGTVHTESANQVTIPLAELLARSSRHIRKAAKLCYQGSASPANSSQLVEFDFIVVFGGGQAKVDEVILVRSDLEDKKLERCIINEVSKASWKTPKSRTFRKRWRQSISLAEIAR